MKKIIYLFSILLITIIYSTSAIAQNYGIGINTTNPKATLDVNGSIKLSDDDITASNGKLRYKNDCVEVYAKILPFFPISKWISLCNPSETSVQNITNTVTQNYSSPTLSADKLVVYYGVTTTTHRSDKESFPWRKEGENNDVSFMTSKISSSDGDVLELKVKKEGLYNLSYKNGPTAAGGKFSDGFVINNVSRISVVRNNISNYISVKESSAIQGFKVNYRNGGAGYLVSASNVTTYLKVGDIIKVRFYRFGEFKNGFNMTFYNSKNNTSNYFKAFYLGK